MRAYRDPTADAAIANVMKEWKETAEFRHRQEGKKRRHNHGNRKGGSYGSPFPHLKEGDKGNDRNI
mgnify:CR=1 FL=1